MPGPAFGDVTINIYQPVRIAEFTSIFTIFKVWTHWTELKDFVKVYHFIDLIDNKGIRWLLQAYYT